MAPTGANPATGEEWKIGDTYHLLFITSGATQATSSDIATYNTFVNDQAALSSLPGVSGLEWFAIATTSTSIHPRDNAPVSAPIYRLDDVLLATGFDQFYGDPPLTGDNFTGLPATPTIDQHGNSRGGNVWTGSNRQGLAAASNRVLGQLDPRFGSSSNTRNYLDAFNMTSRNTAYPMYALSGPLTVVPEPSSLALLGFGGLLLLLRRRK